MHSEDDIPLTPAQEELDSSEASLKRLEERLEKVREPDAGANRKFALGIGLVASLGFVVAGGLFGGYLLGNYLFQRTGQKTFQLLGLLFGLVIAVFAAAKLMKPLMKSDD